MKEVLFQFFNKALNDTQHNTLKDESDDSLDYTIVMAIYGTVITFCMGLYFCTNPFNNRDNTNVSAEETLAGVTVETGEDAATTDEGDVQLRNPVDPSIPLLRN